MLPKRVKPQKRIEQWIGNPGQQDEQGVKADHREHNEAQN